MKSPLVKKPGARRSSTNGSTSGASDLSLCNDELLRASDLAVSPSPKLRSSVHSKARVSCQLSGSNGWLHVLQMAGGLAQCMLLIHPRSFHHGKCHAVSDQRPTVGEPCNSIFWLMDHNHMLIAIAYGDP